MEKVKHHSDYSIKILRDYNEFVMLAGFIEFQDILWHQLDIKNNVGKGFHTRKERLAIESLYYDENRKDSEHYEDFVTIEKEVIASRFFEVFSEEEIVQFINELIVKNHLEGFRKISQISDLKEKEAARIIAYTYYEWEAVGIEWKSKTERVMKFEHVFFDFAKKKIKKNFKTITPKDDRWKDYVVGDWTPEKDNPTA